MAAFILRDARNLLVLDTESEPEEGPTRSYIIRQVSGNYFVMDKRIPRFLMRRVTHTFRRTRAKAFWDKPIHSLFKPLDIRLEGFSILFRRKAMLIWNLHATIYMEALWGCWVSVYVKEWLAW